MTLETPQFDADPFEAFPEWDDAGVTLVLRGRMTEPDVPRLRSLLDRAAASEPDRVVLDVTDLVELPVAAVRLLAVAIAELEPGARVAFCGIGQRVASTLRTAGLVPRILDPPPVATPQRD